VDAKDILYSRARIFKLLKTSGIDSTESIPFENQCRSEIDSREGVREDPRMKSVTALKIYILWYMAT
jgi:hypothetical protein